MNCVRSSNESIATMDLLTFPGWRAGKTRCMEMIMNSVEMNDTMSMIAVSLSVDAPTINSSKEGTSLYYTRSHNCVYRANLSWEVLSRVAV